MKKTRPRFVADALIVVDVQHAFHAPPSFLAAIRRYTRRFPLRVFTRFVNPPGSLFRRRLGLVSCAPGSSDLGLHIRPRKDDLVIDKRGYGLSAADIRRLRAAGVKRAIVCGMDTDACVLGVMFSLIDGGIDCSARRSLCRSSGGLHAPALRIIGKNFPGP